MVDQNKPTIIVKIVQPRKKKKKKGPMAFKEFEIIDF